MTDATGPARLLIQMPWGRVGSNLLVMMLQDSLPAGTTDIANEPFLQIKQADAQSAWLEAHFGEPPDGPMLVGCKNSMRATADADRLARDIERLGLSLLRHRRRNIVKVTVSVLRARLYAERALAEAGEKKWGVARGEDPLPPAPLDPESFVPALRNAGRADAALQAFAPDCPTHDLDYETLHGDPEAVTAEVLAWLGLDAARPARPRFAKATADSLAEAVPNLAELRAAANAAGLERYDRMFEA